MPRSEIRSILECLQNSKEEHAAGKDSQRKSVRDSEGSWEHVDLVGWEPLQHSEQGAAWPDLSSHKVTVCVMKNVAKSVNTGGYCV